MTHPSTPYLRLGGDAAVKRLAERFYAIMDELPETYPLRKVHPQDLSGSAEKLYEFLSGWTGGPPLFVDKHGPPMLRRRHLPFAIGEAERDQWLLCMRLALDDVVADTGLRDELYAALEKLADHMRNQPSCDAARHAA
jgi:hemoglobin